MVKLLVTSLLKSVSEALSTGSSAGSVPLHESSLLESVTEELVTGSAKPLLLKSVTEALGAGSAPLRELPSAAESSYPWDRYCSGGNERMKIRALINSIEHSLVPRGFRVYGEKTDELIPFTRFFRSMEDFSFFKLPTFENELTAVNVTSAREIKFEEVEVELGTCAGESKNKASGSNIWQLIANMNKAAGRLATTAIKAHKLFWKISVYGILCDYSTMTVTEVRKLEMDFRSKQSVLYELGMKTSGFTIEEALVRIASKIAADMN